MNRRTFLQCTGAAGVAGLAGCMADADETDDSGSDGTPTPTPADDGVDDEPAVVTSSIEQVASDCSSGEDATAAVSMDEEALTVTFSGQVTTGNPCHDVTLDSVEYDADADRLALVVGTEATDQVCVDCVGLLEFEGTVEFEGGLPGEAYVGHGDTVLTDTSGADDPGSGEPEAVELVTESFTVTNTESSSAGSADASFDPETNTVTVTGTIVGNDGCTTAELGDASYDPATDTLSVDVVTTRRDGTEDQACTQALVGIDYEAAFEFEGGIAHSVSISHDGQGIAGAGFETASESATPEEN